MYYKIQIDADTWIAAWSGDPGRTYDRQKAKVFANKTKAELAIARIKKQNQHRKLLEMKVVEE